MTDKTKRRTGLTLAIFGLLLLTLNAADYLMRWTKMSSGLTAIAIMLVVIGAGLARRRKNS